MYGSSARALLDREGESGERTFEICSNAIAQLEHKCACRGFCPNNLQCVAKLGGLTQVYAMTTVIIFVPVASAAAVADGIDYDSMHNIHKSQLVGQPERRKMLPFQQGIMLN